MKLKDETILRTECEIHVSKGGHFEVYLAGRAEEEGARALAGDSTLEGAIARAKPAIRARRVRVKVPFFTTRGEKRVAVGIHAGTGNVLLDNGEQWSGSFRDAMSGDTPQKLIDEMVRLNGEYHECYNRVAHIQQKYKLNVLKAVEKAIDAAQANKSE